MKRNEWTLITKKKKRKQTDIKPPEIFSSIDSNECKGTSVLLKGLRDNITEKGIKDLRKFLNGKIISFQLISHPDGTLALITFSSVEECAKAMTLNGFYYETNKISMSVIHTTYELQLKI